MQRSTKIVQEPGETNHPLYEVELAIAEFEHKKTILFRFFYPAGR